MIAAQPGECNHLDHILHSMKANLALNTYSMTPITELYIFSTFEDDLRLKYRTVFSRLLCTTLTNKEEENKAASHLWVYGCLPKAGLIVAENSGHHLKLLLCQVRWGQPQTLHLREFMCLDFLDSWVSKFFSFPYYQIWRAQMKNSSENRFL